MSRVYQSTNKLNKNRTNSMTSPGRVVKGGPDCGILAMDIFDIEPHLKNEVYYIGAWCGNMKPWEGQPPRVRWTLIKPNQTVVAVETTRSKPNPYGSFNYINIALVFPSESVPKLDDPCDQQKAMEQLVYDRKAEVLKKVQEAKRLVKLSKDRKEFGRAIHKKKEHELWRQVIEAHQTIQDFTKLHVDDKYSEQGWSITITKVCIKTFSYDNLVTPRGGGGRPPASSVTKQGAALNV